MTHGRLFLISIIVVGLSLISVVVFAQSEDLGQRVVIYPWEGEVTVSSDDTVVLAGRWSTCTRGLAQAWTEISYINYTVHGKPLFASKNGAQQYWGQPVPDDNPWQENCVNKSAKRWTVYWENELGKLETGSHPISFEMGTDHPFHDGFDFDQDGNPDIQVWRYEFDLIINVIDGGAISGAVYEESGGPLEGLDVVACLYDNFELCWWDTTDVNGNYMIYPVPEDEYRVHVFRQEEWVEEFYDNTPIWDFASPVPVFAHAETPNVNFTLERGGSISGTVTNLDGTEPIGGIEVHACLYDQEWGCWGEMTQEDGNYIIRGLPPGQYRVKTFSEELWVEEYYQETPHWDEATPVVVSVGSETPDINFTLEMGGALAGTVTNMDGTEPIGDISVHACPYDEGEQCWGDQTRDDGSYSIRGIPSGLYRVNTYSEEILWIEEFYQETPHWDEATPVVLSVGSETPDINFTLEMGGGISGIVTNQDGTEPISGIDVHACPYDDDWQCWGDRTREDGSYSIRGIPAGLYRVNTYTEEFFWIQEFYQETPHWDEATPVVVSVGSETLNVNFTLEMGGSISGTVMSGGEPVQFLWVDACEFGLEEDAYCASSETNEDGEYTIGGLPGGDYIVSVWNQGWVSQDYDVEPPEGEPDRVSVIVGDDHGGIDFALELGGSISGRATDEFGEPITFPAFPWVEACEYGVEEDAYCANSETNEDGEYTIESLPGGDYIVSIGNQGWVSQVFDAEAPYGEPDRVSVTPGVDHGGINFALTQAGTVSGTVLDSEGNPIPNIGVDIVEGWHGVCTDDTGFYSIATLPFGTYDIVAGRDFCGVGSYVEVVVEEITVSLDAPHVEGLNFVLSRAGTVSGTVLDSDGSPIPNIGVDIVEGGYGACTDENGDYMIRSLPFGTYDIVAGRDFCGVGSYVEVVVEEITVSLDAPHVEGLNFVLSRAGTVSGTVFDSDENLIPNIGVDIVEGGYGVCTDENGNYMIRSLPFGTYDIVAGRDFCGEVGYAESVIVNVEVSEAAPDVVDLNFNLGPAGTISGRVVDDALGQGISGISVEVNDFYTYDWVDGSHTDSEGYYTVPGLAPGDYRICIWDQFWIHQCYNMAIPGAETLVSLATGEHRDNINFTLTPAGTISGWVYESDGATPIPDILVGAGGPSGGGGACTDEFGFYLIGSLPYGTYDVDAGGDYCGEGGFAKATIAGISLSAEAPHATNVNFNLGPAGTISGRVVDDVLGQGISGISVEVNDFESKDWVGGTQTDADGYYSVSGLAAGDYRICIWDHSWVHQCYDNALPGSETKVILATGEHRPEINFSLLAAGSISGTITDEMVGDPIVGIGVGACQFYVVNDPVCYGTTTNSAGAYTMTGLIPDNYLVFVSGQAGWMDERFDNNIDTPVLVESGQDVVGIDFALEPDPPP